MPNKWSKCVPESKVSLCKALQKRYWFNKELGAGFGNLRKDTFVEYDELFKTSGAHGQRKGNSMFCLVTWAGKTSFVTLYSGQFMISTQLIMLNYQLSLRLACELG